VRALASPRLALAHTPTPIGRSNALDVLGLGDRRIELWVKRDDATGGAEAGNKIRKLEYLLAAARAANATVLVTCGGIQSNHARATSIVGARLGLRSVLLLRTMDTSEPLPVTGNVLLDRMVGAEIRLITPAEYRDRAARMEAVASELEALGERPYVIPEGGSNGLGSLGYVLAMEEVRTQIDVGLAGSGPFDVVVHACGSGGTAAGVALGAARSNSAKEVWPMAVCDDVAYFQSVIERIIAEARTLEPSLPDPAKVVLDDREKGPRYAVSTDEQKRLLVQVARGSGLLLDPVYTGKAFAGLVRAAREGVLDGKRVLFLHTGGLPGLLAQGDELAGVL
jgi:D-cysteine desulfhydrase